VLIYSYKYFTEFYYCSEPDDNEEFSYENMSADTLFRILILDYAKYEEKEAVKGVRNDRLYTILNTKFNDVCADDNGAYLNSRSTKKLYCLNIDRMNNEVSAQTVHKGDGYLYCNQRNSGNSYDQLPVKESDVWLLERYYRENKSIPALKRMVVRVKAFDNSMYEPHICVVYSRKYLADSEDSIVSHGNSKNNDRPYIRTSTETLNTEKELLSRNPGMPINRFSTKFVHTSKKRVDLKVEFASEWYKTLNLVNLVVSF